MERTPEELATKRLSSRNLTVTGSVLVERGLELTTTTTKRGRVTGSHTDLYMPLVPAGWNEKQPVSVIVEVQDEQKLKALVAQGQPVSMPGTLRDVAWEGVPAKVRDQFKADGLVVDENVLLFQMGKPHDAERGLGFPLAGLGLAVLLIVGARSKR